MVCRMEMSKVKTREMKVLTAQTIPSANSRVRGSKQQHSETWEFDYEQSGAMQARRKIAHLVTYKYK